MRFNFTFPFLFMVSCFRNDLGLDRPAHPSPNFFRVIFLFRSFGGGVVDYPCGGGKFLVPFEPEPPRPPLPQLSGVFYFFVEVWGQEERAGGGGYCQYGTKIDIENLNLTKNAAEYEEKK